jgi:hypothetical protein
LSPAPRVQLGGRGRPALWCQVASERRGERVHCNHWRNAVIGRSIGIHQIQPEFLSCSARLAETPSRSMWSGSRRHSTRAPHTQRLTCTCLIARRWRPSGGKRTQVLQLCNELSSLAALSARRFVPLDAWRWDEVEHQELSLYHFVPAAREATTVSWSPQAVDGEGAAIVAASARPFHNRGTPRGDPKSQSTPAPSSRYCRRLARSSGGRCWYNAPRWAAAVSRAGVEDTSQQPQMHTAYGIIRARFAGQPSPNNRGRVPANALPRRCTRPHSHALRRGAG